MPIGRLTPPAPDLDSIGVGEITGLGLREADHRGGHAEIVAYLPVKASFRVRLRAAIVRARDFIRQVMEITGIEPAHVVLIGTSMSLDPTVLRSSFELVIERRPDLTMRFYEILFARYPDLAPMFRRDRQGQAKMLAGAISAVLDHLEDAPWLSATLGDLGAKHADYGVTDAMYGQVGDALLATLAEVAAEAWTPIVAEQWTMAYGAIAQLMQAGVGQRANISRTNAA